MADPLLSISGLTTRLRLPGGHADAVSDLSLTVMPGETLGIVGESGCGKTMLALSILRLVPDPPGRIAEGSILFKGRELMDLSEREMRAVRGNHISMIFQEPMTALNPVFTIGEQIAEALRLHRNMNAEQALGAAAELLSMVGISHPERRLGSFPHEFSGGMRQRVVIAMALACDPDLILADEPTTALDVTIQAQILNLLSELTTRKNAAVMLITHDLGVAAQTCDRIMVMYAGRIVEGGTVEELFADPKHPYTRGLLMSLPKSGGRGEPLHPIAGTVPSLTEIPEGCAFHPRCPEAFGPCAEESPELYSVSNNGEPGDGVRCFLYR